MIGYAAQQTTTCANIWKKFGLSKIFDDVRGVRLGSRSRGAPSEAKRESSAPWTLGDGGVIGGSGSNLPGSRYGFWFGSTISAFGESLEK